MWCWKSVSCFQFLASLPYMSIIAENRAEGRAEREEGFILNIYHNNFTSEQIALATGKSIEEIKAVTKGREAVLV
ncbi:hypothetical protein D3Z36_07440 [Lachnospiraceae bacterium]|nr:hypothetical protein [Lachnospiraceae bacterium]